jgi:hypothetical protein
VPPYRYRHVRLTPKYRLLRRPVLDQPPFLGVARGWSAFEVWTLVSLVPLVPSYWRPLESRYMGRSAGGIGAWGLSHFAEQQESLDAAQHVSRLKHPTLAAHHPPSVPSLCGSGSTLHRVEGEQGPLPPTEIGNAGIFNALAGVLPAKWAKSAAIAL